MIVPTISHTVKKGENLTAIAKKHDYPGGSWRASYDAKHNKWLDIERQTTLTFTSHI